MKEPENVQFGKSWDLPNGSNGARGECRGVGEHRGER